MNAVGAHRTEGFPYAIDNGAWSAYQAFIKRRQATALLDRRAFIKVVVRLGGSADFVVVPDIVAAGKESLALSKRWLPWVLDHTQLALIAVQDGMVPSDVAELLGPRVGLFVGGSCDPPDFWKLSTMAQWCDLARKHGAWCHIGRVNSALRIRKCALAGATSFDGSSASRFALTIPPLDDARRQQFFHFEHQGEAHDRDPDQDI